MFKCFNFYLIKFCLSYDREGERDGTLYLLCVCDETIGDPLVISHCNIMKFCFHDIFDEMSLYLESQGQYTYIHKFTFPRQACATVCQNLIRLRYRLFS